MERDPTTLPRYFAYMFVDRKGTLSLEEGPIFVYIGISKKLVTPASPNGIVPIGFGLEDSLENVLKKVLDGALYRPLSSDAARGLKTTKEEEITIPVYAAEDVLDSLNSQWEVNKELVITYDAVHRKRVRFLYRAGNKGFAQIIP